MAKMSDDDLLNQIDILERQASGFYQHEVAAEQARNLDMYYSKPFGNEEEGRSRVISSDVWDVVEGMTPMIAKPFVSSDDVVKFNPLGPDDEDAAQQESDYINWVVTQRNDSFGQLVTAIKAGLLQKNGIAKYWWEVRQNPTVERYYGVPDDVYALWVQESGAEVIEHSEAVDELGQVVHDVTLRTVEEVGAARYAVIPHEEFLISRDATTPNPQEARFVQHRRKVTIGDLRAMGYDIADDINDGTDEDPAQSLQYQARRDYESDLETDQGIDPSLREVLYKETFLRVDKDGDGLPELRKVCSVGKVILSDEETEEIPFVSWTPYPQAFRFWGKCPADETAEIQLIKSTLWRQSLDNIYTINNNRVFANESVTLDDLIDNQIAGVVRIKGNLSPSSAVMPAPITPIGGVVQPMIEYLDSAKENRTGFTRYNQGTDSNSLNKTATGVRLITEAANGRVEIIARAFAEQFLAPLMRGVHGLCRRHATQAETIRLRGKWVPIDPRGWKRRIDMTVSVGLGNTDLQMKLQGLQVLMQEQKALAQVPGLVQPQNLYASASKLAEVLGFKAAEEFFSAPQEQQGLPPEVQGVLQQAQQEIQALQQQIQELQSGVAVKQIEIQGRQATEALKAETAVKIAEIQADAAHDREELKGLIQMILQKMQPPPALEQAVAEDMAENEAEHGQD